MPDANSRTAVRSALRAVLFLFSSSFASCACPSPPSPFGTSIAHLSAVVVGFRRWCGCGRVVSESHWSSLRWTRLSPSLSPPSRAARTLLHLASHPLLCSHAPLCRSVLCFSSRSLEAVDPSEAEPSRAEARRAAAAAEAEPRLPTQRRTATSSCATSGCRDIHHRRSATRKVGGCGDRRRCQWRGCCWPSPC